jgi:choline dehydrogenase
MLKDAITAGLPNLQIKLNTTATRILNNGYDSHGNLQVTGVSAVYNDGTSTTDFNYFANKGVILAAGAFNSPQLLMVSGIGDSDHLSSLGIPVKVELKGVGQNLKDHYGLPLIYVLKQFSPINNATFFNEQLAQYASDGTGYFAWPAFNHALITANSNGNVNTKPDVAFATGPWNFNFPDPHQSVVFPILVNPYSTGTVKIRSDSVFDQPIIDPNYFGDSRDYDTLTNAFNVARTILGQSAFSDWFNFEVFPTGVPDAVVKTTVTSTEHYMGTCKMGKHNDEYAVVDNDGSVFGTNNLYIADASAIPVTGGALPDASIHASVILLSKIIADSLLCDFGNVCN